VVGTLLNLIDQGDAIFGAAPVDWVKLMLTFAMPYAVSTYGAVSLRLGSQSRLISNRGVPSRRPGCTTAALLVYHGVKAGKGTSMAAVTAQLAAYCASLDFAALPPARDVPLAARARGRQPSTGLPRDTSDRRGAPFPANCGGAYHAGLVPCTLGE